MVEISKIIVHGVQETIDNIQEFEKETDRQLGMAMAKVTIRVAQTAKANAPFRTGFLRQHIIQEVKINSRSRITGRVISQANYSAAQEFGTSRIPATRFMRNSIKSNLSFAQATLGNALRKAIVRGTIK